MLWKSRRKKKQEVEKEVLSQDVTNPEETKDEEEKKELPPMESIAEVDTVYDYRLMKYCNMYIIRIKRKSHLAYSVMAAICFIIGILLIFTGGPNKYLSIIIILLGIITLTNIFTEEKKIDKSLENFFRTHAPVVQHFALNREKIRVTIEENGERKSADYPWAYIQEIHAIPEFFMLFLSGGMPIVLDRSEEKITKGTKDDLEQLIKEQSASKPFNRFDGKLVKVLKDIVYYSPVQPDKETDVNQEKPNSEEKPMVTEEKKSVDIDKEK